MPEYNKILKYSLIFATSLFFVLPATAATPTSGTVNSVARVRDSAGFTRVLVVLAQNTKIRITGEKGVWYQIQRKDGSTGWIAKELVDADKIPAAKAEGTSIATKSAILKYNAKLREKPTTESKAIRVLPGGSSIQISEIKDAWCSVTDKAKALGWVSCPLLDFKEPAKIAQNAALLDTQISETSIGDVTTADINDYWLGRVNSLRKEKGLRLLAIDESLKKTAAVWSDYLGKNNLITHDRPDGKSMMEWIEDKGIDFSTRGTKDGWQNNYFTENIGLRLNVESSLDGVKKAMDGVLQMFLAEGPSGVHYRSIYAPDWNSVGVAWHATKNANGRYKVNFVFHYGSIAK